MASTTGDRTASGVLVLDEAAIGRTLTRIAHEIIEQHTPARLPALAGIPTRGAVLADRLAGILDRIGDRPDVLTVDPGPYRDDEPRPRRIPEPPASVIDGREVVLVDDVLHTGRTVRAALDGLAETGRPARVRLAVLIDRGRRELPIRADFVGKNLPTASDERVTVLLHETDGVDGAWLVPANGETR